MFKLSDLLGGRSEVVDAPAVELMKYMEMAIEEAENKHKAKQAEMYINYLSNVFSQQLEEKPTTEYKRAKEEFIQLITPEEPGKEKKKLPKTYEWDFEPEDLIENKEQAE